MWGRGGNLCKCSAVHFAGKRGGVAAGLAASSEAVGGDPGEESLMEAEQIPFQGMRKNRLADVVLAFLQRGENRDGAENFLEAEREGGLPKGSARLRR